MRAAPSGAVFVVGNAQSALGCDTGLAAWRGSREGKARDMCAAAQVGGREYVVVGTCDRHICCLNERGCRIADTLLPKIEPIRLNWIQHDR